MTSVIKPKRGTGSPAGSLSTNEIAMDTTNKKLYVSTNGSDAVILADNTQTYLDAVNLVTYSGDTPTDITIGSCEFGTGAAGERLELTGGSSGIRIKSAVDAQANNITTTGTVTGGTLAGTAGNITTVTATTLSGTTLQSESGNDLTIFPNDDQKLVLKNTKSSDTAQIDITYNGSNQFDIDAETTSNKRLALRGDRVSLLASGASADSDITVRDDRIVLGVNGVLYAQLRSDQVQLSKELDLNGVNVVDANIIKGQSGSNIEIQSLGTNNIVLTSTNDIDMVVGNVDSDNVNITGKTNVNATKDQPHALKVITDMEDSHATEAQLHNSMTLLLDGYLQSGNGILDNVQNSLTFQVADDVTTHTVGRFNVEYQANGIGNRVKFISVNNATGTTTSNVEGAVQGTSNGQADVDGQRFKSNVPFLLPSYTTTERGNLSGVQNGYLILNTTTNKVQARVNGAWVDLH